MHKITWYAILVVMALTASVNPARADIAVAPGAFEYTYHAGTDIVDTNASLSQTSFYVETPANGNAAYFATSSAGSTGDVTYILDAPAGYVFSGNLSSVEESLVAFNPGGKVTETVTPNVGLASSAILLSSTDNGFYTDYTSHDFAVSGATSVTIDFTLTNPSGNAIFTQIARETNGTTGSPLVFSGTTVAATPEPASLVVWGLAIAGGFVVARRYRKA